MPGQAEQGVCVEILAQEGGGPLHEVRVGVPAGGVKPERVMRELEKPLPPRRAGVAEACRLHDLPHPGVIGVKGVGKPAHRITGNLLEGAPALQNVIEGPLPRRGAPKAMVGAVDRDFMPRIEGGNLAAGKGLDVLPRRRFPVAVVLSKAAAV